MTCLTRVFSITSLIFGFSTQAFALNQLRITSNLTSADQTGPHRTIAQHIIGFSEGQIVREYLTPYKGCSLRLKYMELANLEPQELFVVLESISTQRQVPNCLSWETHPSGDDVCSEYGQPLPQSELTLQLTRSTTGETAQIYCLAEGRLSKDEMSNLLWRHLGKLILPE